LEKVDQLGNYSRRNNIRVVNLKENCERNERVNFLANWIPVLHPDWFSNLLVSLRVRALCSLHSCSGALSRAADSSHIHKHNAGGLQATVHIHFGDYDCISEQRVTATYEEIHFRK